MEGTNREKLRVLFVKNRTQLGIFFNYTGRRVKYPEIQGLLRKHARAKG